MVYDDGQGFDPQHKSPGHYGLGMMRERAEAIGALLSVTSQPGHGTELTLRWSPQPTKGTLMTDTLSKPIRVMLVDDHMMVRRGLATFLKVFDDMQLAGEAESGEAAVQLCAEVMPDVILMDMLMPGMDGAAATRIIREQFPHIQIIMLTSFKEGELINKALESGAIGYLLKNVFGG